MSSLQGDVNLFKRHVACLTPFNDRHLFGVGPDCDQRCSALAHNIKITNINGIDLLS